MDARQRRMFVLPAPKGNIDRRDRYEIGIFYSFIIMTATKPVRVLFEAMQGTLTFISEKASNVFRSARKTSKDC